MVSFIGPHFHCLNAAKMIACDDKWIVFKKVERKRSWGNQNKTPLTHPKSSLRSKKGSYATGVIGRALCITRFIRKLRRYKYCSELDNKLMKSVGNWRTTRALSSIRTIPDLTSLCRRGRNWYRLDGISTVLTKPHCFGLPFNSILAKFMIRNSISWKHVKNN